MFRCATIVGIAVALVGACLGVAPLSAADEKEPAKEPVIQPNTKVSVMVDGEPSLSKEYTVDAQGDITMEMVGKVRLAGLKADEAKQKLTDELKKYLRIFSVSVTLSEPSKVEEDTGARVLIYGAVARPGAVKLQRDTTLLDVMAEAGPTAANADLQHVEVLRKETGQKEMVDFEAILKDASKSVPVKDGDRILVPSRGLDLVQIDGEVRSPGLRSLEYFKTAYAVVVSAGPAETADWSRVAIRHKGSDTPVWVDLSGVRAGKEKDDLLLQPGDHLTMMSRVLGTAVVRGAVTSPGEKVLTSRMGVWDFIATVGGGFSETADRAKVEVQRGGKTLATINLEDAARGAAGGADQGITVEPGDVVFVPNLESRLFAIIGGVRKAGSFAVKPKMTMLDAIVTAEGLTVTAIKNRIVLAPQDPQDERLKALHNAAQTKQSQEAADLAKSGMAVIDYSRLLAGDATQNVDIRPGDRIIVPEKAMRQGRGFLGSVLSLVPLASVLLR